MHQTERVEVSKGLLRVRMLVHLAVGDFANVLFGCDHHRSLHARVCNVGDDLQRDQSLLELNDLLLHSTHWLLVRRRVRFDHDLVYRQFGLRIDYRRHLARNKMRIILSQVLLRNRVPPIDAHLLFNDGRYSA